jgi:hypothetical protein
MENTTTAFSQMTWQLREKTLGDPAEQAFREWADPLGYVTIRYGLDRPPLQVGKLPPFIRYAPDFLSTECFFEVQGCGKDQTFKFKHDKLWALHEWHQHHNVRLWLWNQTIDRNVNLPLLRVLDLCDDPTIEDWRTDGMFDGHKPFAAVHWEALVGAQ